MGSTVPSIDAGVRRRLTARFGREAKAWFDELPGLLATLARQWRLEFGDPIPRGSVSPVFRCGLVDGRRVVLKASPDRARLAFEAAALRAWPTVHTPDVIAVDEPLGALLIEAIEPGTPPPGLRPLASHAGWAPDRTNTQNCETPERYGTRFMSFRRFLGPRPHHPSPTGPRRGQRRLPAGGADESLPSAPNLPAIPPSTHSGGAR